MMTADERRVWNLERKRDALVSKVDRMVLRAGKLSRIAEKAWSQVGEQKAAVDALNTEIVDARTRMARQVVPETPPAPAAEPDKPTEQEQAAE